MLPIYVGASEQTANLPVSKESMKKSISYLLVAGIYLL